MSAFQQFLYQKRIHAEAWKSARSEEYEKLEVLFGKMGSNSFDQQKKFLFNPVRLEFPLPEELVPPPVKKAKPALPKKSPTAAASKPSPPLKGKLPLTKKPGAPSLSGKARLTPKQPATDSPEKSSSKAPALKGKVKLTPKKQAPDSSEQQEKSSPKPPSLKGKVKLTPKMPKKEDDSEEGSSN
ncbi:MAG: hypothetical protein AAGM67_15865 [Bacteroidota bacterium]